MKVTITNDAGEVFLVGRVEQEARSGWYITDDQVGDVLTMSEALEDAARWEASHEEREAK